MAEPFHVGELVKRAQAGDEQAATELYAACRERMLPIIRAIMPSRLRTMWDSEDFVQEGMINLISAKFESAVLESPARFWPYLKRVVENKVRDVSRKYLATGRFGFRRETAVSDEELHGIAARVELSIEDAILLKNLAVDHLNAILNTVNPLDTAIAFLLVKGYSVESIAHTIHTNPEHVLEAVERMKTKLERRGG